MSYEFPPQQPPPPPDHRPRAHPRRWAPVAAAAAGAIVLAGLGIGGYVLFGPQSHASPRPAAVAGPAPASKAPPTVVVQQPETRTVTVPGPTHEVPAVTAPDPAVSVTDAYPYSCYSAGGVLTALVGIDNPTGSTHDFIGTLEFTDSVGNYLGKGGFSTANLGPYGTASESVDTSDPNDPRASTGDLTGTDGPVNCSVSDLHTK